MNFSADGDILYLNHDPLETKTMFIYEMHFHTHPCSGGGDDIIKQIDKMKKNGFTGAFLTDHFYSGDTRIDRELDWASFVGEYEKAYLRGVEYAKKVDFDLYFGIEEHIGEGLEILVYGITPKVLYDHPEFREGRLDDYIRVVHELGGLIFQSHPYRARWYIPNPRPIERLDEIDGIEAYNASNYPEENEKAAELARERGLKCTAGSDGHHVDSCARAGIMTHVRPKNLCEMIEIMKSGNYEIYKGVTE